MATPPRDREQLKARLLLLREEHAALDAAVHAMGLTGVADQLKMVRLKKQKLRVKDEIEWIEDQLNPDAIA